MVKLSQDSFPLCLASLELSDWRFGVEERPSSLSFPVGTVTQAQDFLFLVNYCILLAADVWDSSIFTGILGKVHCLWFSFSLE